jgi:hypothetical protein
VPDHGEPFEPERLHQLDLILGHDSFGVLLVPFVGRWLGAVTVATQIGADDREALGKGGSYPVPRNMRLGYPCRRRIGGPAPP